MKKKKQLNEENIKNVSGGFDYRKITSPKAIPATKQNETSFENLPIIGESNPDNNNENVEAVLYK